MTHQASPRTADRVYDRLPALLERMMTANQPEETDTVPKAPTFNGKGGVEYFILQFRKVSGQITGMTMP